MGTDLKGVRERAMGFWGWGRAFQTTIANARVCLRNMKHSIEAGSEHVRGRKVGVDNRLGSI